MPVDHLRYDILVQDALRAMVRGVLADAARKGLPGDHHFFITFDTTAEGVRLSERLRERYPEEMTIVLQHQFWDLKVTDEAFEVGLSFSGVPERLSVPFAAINGFADPTVQFALQFETLGEAADETAAETGVDAGAGKAREQAKGKPRKPVRAGRARTSVPTSPAPPPERPPAAAAGRDAPPHTPQAPPAKPQVDKPGAEVVRLDRFRKK
jgi:hypothetical protein